MSALPAGAKARFFLDVERSVCGRAWHDRLDDRASARALSIVQRHGMPELLARVLAARDVAPEDVEAFLDPTVKRLMPDPDRLIDMGAAAARIADAVTRGEQVAIFGDYDVDGATSAALLTRFLRAGGLDPIIHIPDRLFEGYGPNVEAVQSLAQRGATLLVAVDCGTTSHEPLETARRLGLDVVVIDHHLADERLPPALAVVNPNRLDDLSGLGHLAAVGLVFMTIVAVNRVLRTRGFWSAQRSEPDLLGFLDLVALGTVADVVALKGLNRAFVVKGLIAMRRREGVGLTALMDAARLAGPPEPWHLGFLLGPRINAGGRIGRADLGTRLLLTDDPVEAATHRRRARPAQPRAPGDRAGDARRSRSGSDGGARPRGEGGGGGHRRGRLASRRGRPGGGTPARALRPPRLRHRARRRAAPARGRGARSPASTSAMRCAAPWPTACSSRAAATPWRPASPSRATASPPSGPTWRIRSAPPSRRRVPKTCS